MKKLFLGLLIMIIIFTGCSQKANEYYESGKAKLLQQNYQGAIEDYSKAIESKSDFAKAYNARGCAKIGLRDFKGAIADFTKTIEIDPNFGDAYANRATASGNLGLDNSADIAKSGELFLLNLKKKEGKENN